MLQKNHKKFPFLRCNFDVTKQKVFIIIVKCCTIVEKKTTYNRCYHANIFTDEHHYFLYDFHPCKCKQEINIRKLHEQVHYIMS